MCENFYKVCYNRTIESFNQENTYKIMNPALPRPPLNSEPKCLLYRSFKDLQGWQLKNFPDQSVQMLEHLLHEEIFPNCQSKISWHDFRLFSFLLLDCYLGKENVALSVAIFATEQFLRQHISGPCRKIYQFSVFFSHLNSHHINVQHSCQNRSIFCISIFTFILLSQFSQGCNIIL